MHFKLIIAVVEDADADEIVDAAREAGATGATIINQARGEGMKPAKTFFGMDLDSQRDVVLLLVEEHLSRHILESVGTVGEFDTRDGAGIAFQVDVEDAVGILVQARSLTDRVEEEL